MLSKAFYRRILGAVSLIVLLSLVGSYLVVAGVSFFLACICFSLVFLIAFLVLRRVNGMNRQMSAFFEAIRNDDMATRYPERVDDPFLRASYVEMNRILALFQRNKEAAEERRLYYEGILRVMTHEIRNSITPIRSLAADLIRYADAYTPEEAREGVKVIHEQAGHLVGFLDAYHRLTHLPEPERTEVPVGSLFRKLERLLHAEPGIERVRFHAPDDLVVFADRNLFVLALINLIRNASQSIEGQEDGLVAVEGEREQGRGCITITDNGPGIPPERLSVIFTPFFSTKRGGSGIGLSIAYRIMRLHGGDLTVESVPGIRTVFRLSF